jgi:hypothetical protein
MTAAFFDIGGMLASAELAAHLFVPPRSAALIEVLAQQPINPSASGHPFVEAANRVFNALLQVRREAVGGRLFICDATMWSL